MICPFCNKEMKKGTLSGDGRSRVRWVADDEKMGVMDKIVGKGMVDVDYSFCNAKFEKESYYCWSCKKMIFDAEITN